MNQKVKDFLNENIDKTVKVTKESSGTLIGLPYPYTTPCVSDAYQEIYYWDTYFANAGFILWGKEEYAKNNIANMIYLIEKYGFMPNGNRTFYLNRSQPPFLSHMVRDVFDNTKDTEWLKPIYTTLKKEYDFWQTKRNTPTGLNGYTRHELVKEAVNGNFEYFNKRIGNRFTAEETEEIKLKFYYAGVSVYESGWDCSSRFKTEGYELDAIDLNSLLYGMEENMRYFAKVLETGEEELWEQRKAERKEKMQNLWNKDRGIFMDKNFVTGEFSTYASAASFYPMFTKVATEEQAKSTVENLFEKLNLKYGISAGDPATEWDCQWDYPNVWAPIQFVVYNALMNYGYEAEAKIVAEKYVHLVESNFEKTQNLWEKYNGNTGERASLEYKAEPMIGWTAGTYIYLNKELGLI